MDKLIAWLERSTFFVDPASAKYHGDYEGGLCDHSLAVYEEYVKLTGVDDDKAKITCLLHDVCKIGTYKLGYRNVKNEQGQWQQVPQYENQESGFPFGHGEKSVLMISSFIKLTKNAKSSCSVFLLYVKYGLAKNFVSSLRAIPILARPKSIPIVFIVIL